MTDLDWHRLPSLSSLRAFEAAARLGGFSAAARALNVTHAAVAQAVRGLEAELGLQLLRREGRGLALTMEGERLAGALRRGFGAIAEGVELLRSTEGRRGLRVTATPVFSEAVLMPRLADFWRRHPEVAVSISSTLEVVDLAAEGFDLAIRIGARDVVGGAAGPAPGWADVAAEPVLEARFLALASPALAGQVAGHGDLGRIPWAVNRRRQQDLLHLRRGGLDPDRLWIMHLDSPTLALSAALSGYGAVFVSDHVAAGEMAAGRLVELPYPGLPDFTYWAVTRPGPRRPAVAAFVDWLRGPFAADVSRETRAAARGGA